MPRSFGEAQQGSAGNPKPPATETKPWGWNWAAGLALVARGLRGGLARVNGAQPLRQGLQQLPGDGTVPFDQRAKLPERQPVTHQIGRGSHRRHAGTAVDQGDLAEVVSRAEGGDGGAFARDRRLAGVDEEEGGTPGALDDNRLALREAALLEQT